MRRSRRFNSHDSLAEEGVVIVAWVIGIILAVTVIVSVLALAFHLVIWEWSI